MDSYIEYDEPIYEDRARPAPARLAVQKDSSAERQARWRKNNPEKHAEQQRRYRRAKKRRVES